jgi:hypothetical protein
MFLAVPPVTSATRPAPALCAVPRGIPPGFWPAWAAISEFTAFAAGLDRHIASIRTGVRP